ncbi:hypothetical protein A374_15297 [Fictibacillus macauensis ZFHKF-1]|uniref:YqhG n=1 Tax=Fictibacillus macauensis ZFHKF-1 TaxID=1196324 RepID=I8UCK4_9BACL|nr:YqhG family protein [Fictibacillus macauensis]EIT84503.1 hypothetical protein A374_15297 [Fictibacillus macauensis ZFHKF-1]
MQQHEIHDFLERYFEANDCEVLERRPASMKIKLSIEIDKLLMNRPFYWHYLEKTGGTPQPMTLSLATGQQAGDGTEEFIHFGSPRLHQIFASTQKLGSFIRMYEKVEHHNGSNIALHPWLCVNMKTSYMCDQKKDRITSHGIHLINGTILDQFHERLQQRPLSRSIPDYCYTLSPFIKPMSGLKRIESLIEEQISCDDHTWADDARRRWQEDQELLDRFYEDQAQKPECYEVEKEALRTQYEPRIEVTCINGGLFYLSDSFPST